MMMVMMMMRMMKMVMMIEMMVMMMMMMMMMICAHVCVWCMHAWCHVLLGVCCAEFLCSPSFYSSVHSVQTVVVGGQVCWLNITSFFMIPHFRYDDVRTERTLHKCVACWLVAPIKEIMDIYSLFVCMYDIDCCPAVLLIVSFWEYLYFCLFVVCVKTFICFHYTLYPTIQIEKAPRTYWHDGANQDFLFLN